jgi:hypothetical protein
MPRGRFCRARYRSSAVLKISNNSSRANAFKIPSLRHLHLQLGGGGGPTSHRRGGQAGIGNVDVGGKEGSGRRYRRVRGDSPNRTRYMGRIHSKYIQNVFIEVLYNSIGAMNYYVSNILIRSSSELSRLSAWHSTYHVIIA